MGRHGNATPVGASRGIGPDRRGSAIRRARRRGGADVRRRAPAVLRVVVSVTAFVALVTMHGADAHTLHPGPAGDTRAPAGALAAHDHGTGMAHDHPDAGNDGPPGAFADVPHEPSTATDPLARVLDAVTAPLHQLVAWIVPHAPDGSHGLPLPHDMAALCAAAVLATVGLLVRASPTWRHHPRPLAPATSHRLLLDPPVPRLAVAPA